MVRVPPNGIEMNSWIAKQVLDIGVMGIIFPHVSSVEEAANAVGACRYPRLKSAPRYHPPGIRGDAPARAARYWGLPQQEYYKRADVWPLAPDGEVLVVIQCEEMRAIENLPKILKEVPGIGVVLIGEGDLSQELGHPRDYDHPVVADAINNILKICKEHNIPCGHPHPGRAKTSSAWSKDGYRFLMPSSPRSFRRPRPRQKASRKKLTNLAPSCGVVNLRTRNRRSNRHLDTVVQRYDGHCPSPGYRPRRYDGDGQTLNFGPPAQRGLSSLSLSHPYVIAPPSPASRS